MPMNSDSVHKEENIIKPHLKYTGKIMSRSVLFLLPTGLLCLLAVLMPISVREEISEQRIRLSIVILCTAFSRLC